MEKELVVTVKCDGVDTRVEMTMEEISEYFAGLSKWYADSSNATPKHFEMTMDVR